MVRLIRVTGRTEHLHEDHFADRLLFCGRHAKVPCVANRFGADVARVLVPLRFRRQNRLSRPLISFLGYILRLIALGALLKPPERVYTCW